MRLTTSQYLYLNTGGGAYFHTANNGTTAHWGGTILSMPGLGFAAAGSDGNLAFSATAPSAPVACTSPTITHGTSVAFQADVGSSCAGVSTFAFTVPATTNGMRCTGDNITAAATRVLAQSNGWTGTTVTMTNYSRTLGTAADFADGADLVITCVGR